MWILGLLMAFGSGSSAGEAAAIANEIVNNPGSAEAVLKQHNTTAAAYEAQLYEIAADPAQTAEYLAARK